jgi:hypothetical protein
MKCRVYLKNTQCSFLALKLGKWAIFCFQIDLQCCQIHDFSREFTKFHTFSRESAWKIVNLAALYYSRVVWLYVDFWWLPIFLFFPPRPFLILCYMFLKDWYDEVAVRAIYALFNNIFISVASYTFNKKRGNLVYFMFFASRFDLSDETHNDYWIDNWID